MSRWLFCHVWLASWHYVRLVQLKKAFANVYELLRVVTVLNTELVVVNVGVPLSMCLVCINSSGYLHYGPFNAPKLRMVPHCQSLPSVPSGARSCSDAITDQIYIWCVSVVFLVPLVHVCKVAVPRVLSTTGYYRQH